MSKLIDFGFKCDVCSKEQPENKFSVRIFDISEELGFPKGSAVTHVYYCNDSIKCKKGALKIELE